MAETKTTKKTGVQVKKITIKDTNEVSFSAKKSANEPKLAEKKKILLLAIFLYILRESISKADY